MSDSAGQTIAGATMLLSGSIALWKGLSGLVYHTPIYFKAGSQNPWQAVVAEGLCLALGLFLVIDVMRKKGKN
jgi:hypothetical protein